jgi:hypothetical protein
MNYITGEIETLNSLRISHVLCLYPDGQRVVAVDTSDPVAVKWAIDYLEVNGFTIKSQEFKSSQCLITF